jgi:hypothetical protein
MTTPVRDDYCAMAGPGAAEQVRWPGTRAAHVETWPRARCMKPERRKSLDAPNGIRTKPVQALVRLAASYSLS